MGGQRAAGSGQHACTNLLGSPGALLLHQLPPHQLPSSKSQLARHPAGAANTLSPVHVCARSKEVHQAQLSCVTWLDGPQRHLALLGS
jgi:hypothetical protein